MPWLFTLWAFLLGLIVGSFLNVCIYRLPRGQSVVVPRSYCPGCGRFIRWYDNVPLLSYLWLKGRCRACRKRISFRYPLVEAVTALLSVLVCVKFGWGWAYFLYFLLLVAPLVAITFIDLEHKIIPDILSLPGLLGGLVTTAVVSGLSLPSALLHSLWGILAGGGVLFFISWVYERLRRQEGIGGGDIKLAAMLGAFFGWKGIFFILLLGSLLGSVIGLGLLIARRQGPQAGIPFGPFLAASALLYLFLGQEILHWYLAITSKLY